MTGPVRLLVTGGSGFIGTNLQDHWGGWPDELLNLDVSPPLRDAHRPYWRPCDVMDQAALDRAFADFRPTHVVHMAARTDTVEGIPVEDYAVNYEGTEHVMRAAKAIESVQRVLFTSSQFVIGPQHTPAHLHDYAPHTAYGLSKVRAERIVREADPSFTWAITRPVNVWGPWHFRYRREAWRVIQRGRYFHPGWMPVVRTYGYVGNVVWQMRRLLDLPRKTVHQKTVYLGDLPTDIFTWVDAFSRELRGRPARRLPRWILRLVAAGGDLITTMGGRFPLTTSRYRSMTQDYPTPIADTVALLGEPPWSLEAGVDHTVAWLRASESTGGVSRVIERSAG